MDEIRQGKYTLEEVIDNENDTSTKLGIYKENDVLIKKGKFGWYVSYGDKTQSLKSLTIDIQDIKLDDIIPLLETTNILRNLNENTTIRKGPKGDYIFYKTKTMKKPRFLDIKKFTDDYLNCPFEDIKIWVSDTYKISI